jgi:hypothetical protein
MVHYFGAGSVQGFWDGGGQLDSRKAKCRENRKMKITKGEGTLVDTFSSGDDGNFRFGFPLADNTATDDYTVSAAKNHFGSGKRKKTCRADSATLSMIRSANEITIGFDDPSDTFSGSVSFERSECVPGAEWLLSYGEAAPFANGLFDGSANWQYDYGSQPAPGTYIVANAFNSAYSERSKGNADVIVCPSDPVELTL